MAFTLEPGCFEFLYVAKELYDYGLLEQMPEYYGHMEICEDYYSISWDGVSCVFEGFSQYYKEDSEIEIMVFTDSIITEFYRLCELYETKKGVPKESNSFRQDGEDAVYRCFSLDAYDYDVRLYDGSHGQCRVVMLTGQEFCGHSALPGALAEVRNTFQSYSKRLREEIAAERPAVIVLENAADAETEEKEAA